MIKTVLKLINYLNNSSDNEYFLRNWNGICKKKP